MARKKQRPRIKTGPCPFCVAGKDPDYKEYKELGNFLSDRAKILGKDYTAVCSKHQRRLTVEIKRARHLGLLPFSPEI